MTVINASQTRDGEGVARSMSMRTSRAIAHTLTYIVLTLGGVMILIPLVWQFLTAVKPSQEVFSQNLWPSEFRWENFTNSWVGQTSRGFKGWLFLKNTLILSLNGAIATVISSSLVAYGFARHEFPGRDFLFLVCLSTMMLPGLVTMIPTFVLFRTLGWLDTFKPLMVPAWTAGAYNIFLFRQFFLAMPPELEDAARIDGCSDIGFYLRILMPLSWPVIATVAIFSFRYTWQDFMGPLIYLTNHKNFTLTLGLGMFRSEFGTRWNELMAVSLIIMLPPLLLFFFAQRWFIQGIVFTGIKG